MKCYPEYKESGMDWIGEIPNHWRSSRLKFHLSENSGGIWGDDDEFGNGTYVLRSTEITIDGHWNLQNIIKRQLSNEETERFLLKKDDLVITKSSGSQEHIGKTGLVDKKIESMFVCYSNFVQRIRPKNHINSKFLHYFMNCPLAREQYKYQSETTTGLANLSTKSIDELLITFPPLPEQTQIANFLDRKTEKIDELTRIKERQVELLREQRTALINQAVTKGLDPNVEMKPSGVEWVGEIPAHWHTIRCTYLFEKKHIKNTSGEINLSVYRDYGVIKRDSRDDNYNRISEDTSNYKLVEPGDFVLNKMKCWQGSLGISEYRGIVSPAYTVCKPKKSLHGRYFHHLLRSYSYIQEYNRLSYGIRTSQWELRFEDFKDIVVPFPTILEQTQIANFLDQKTEQIDKLIAIENQKIQLLKEYRQSLISEAVTGKIDVRNEP